MNKIPGWWLCLLLAGCYHSQNTQDLNLAIYECRKAGLRAIALRNELGELVIQCRPYKKTKVKT